MSEQHTVEKEVALESIRTPAVLIPGVKAIFPSSTILMEKPLLRKQRLFAFSQ